MNDIETERGEIVMCQPDENIRLEVRAEEETVWLESLMSVKLLFNILPINKSLLSLRRQRCPSWFASKRMGVWN